MVIQLYALDLTGSSAFSVLNSNIQSVKFAQQKCYRWSVCIYENGQFQNRPIESMMMIDEIYHRLMEMSEQMFHHLTVNMRNVLKISNTTI